MTKPTHYEAREFWKNTWLRNPQYVDELNSGAYRRRSVRMVEYFGPDIEDTETFCELGVGSGRNIFYFHEKYPGWKYSGNDINPGVLGVIAKDFPGVLECVNITIDDTLGYLKNIGGVDTLFTHGHLMHIPDSTIGEVCGWMAAKANKYIAIHEAHSHRENAIVFRHERYRFERDYFDMFPGFVCKKSVGELAVNANRIYGMYLFRKEPA